MRFLTLSLSLSSLFFCFFSSSSTIRGICPVYKYKFLPFSLFRYASCIFSLIPPLSHTHTLSSSENILYSCTLHDTKRLRASCNLRWYHLNSNAYKQAIYCPNLASLYHCYSCQSPKASPQKVFGPHFRFCQWRLCILDTEPPPFAFC